MVFQPKTCLVGHPLILGRPWLATNDAYIGCRYGCMTISDGYTIKNLVFYPPSKLSFVLENPQELEFELEETDACPVVTN